MMPVRRPLWHIVKVVSALFSDPIGPLVRTVFTGHGSGVGQRMRRIHHVASSTKSSLGWQVTHKRTLEGLVITETQISRYS